MSRANAHALGVEIRRARTARSLTLRGLAQMAGIYHATLRMLEGGQNLAPQADTMLRLASALDVRATDLFAIAGWLPAAELPELRPYLRGKYRDLDDEQISDVEHYIASLQANCPRVSKTAH